ncbi:MAG TPA: type II CAAX endopeptidase family protein [Ktedonobacteraceae bacterium]|nr:type II CAAX endopeptidase family protein [Ktedonobacteraceae bacterium]
MVEQKFDEVPWTIQQTFLGIALTLVPWIALALLLDLFTGSAVSSSKPFPPQVDLINAIITFILSSLIEGAFLIAPLYFAVRAYRSSPHKWSKAFEALGYRGFRIERALMWIVVLIVAILAVDNLYQYIIDVLHLHLQTNDQVLLARSKLEPLTIYATLLVAVFVAPFCEETYFRSFVFMGFTRAMPLIWAIIFSALVFGVAHADPGSFAVLVIIGLALAFLRWRTNSIWPGMMLHALNNAIAAIAVVLYMNGVLH